MTGAGTVAGLGARIAEVLAIVPSANAVEFEGAWRSWGELADTAAQVAALVDRPGAEIGVIMRNRPATVGVLLGVLQAGGCIVAVNPGRGHERTCEDIAALDLPVIAGHPDDLAELVPRDARAVRVAVADIGEPVVVRDAGDAGSGSGAGRAGVAVRMLTSGTTGPPKRVDLGYSTFERVLVGAKHYESSGTGAGSGAGTGVGVGTGAEAGSGAGTGARVRGGSQAGELRRGVAIVNAPLAHVGGLFRVLQCVTDGRPFALLERFTVEGWLDAVRRHRPKTTSLVPAALRMVLAADLDPDDLSSLRSVISGTAPLDPADADAFFAKYGVPVLVSYGATEFAGGVAGWNIRDHREHWAAKKGSVGRAHAGCELRVVDPGTGDVLGPDTPGVLEVRASQTAEAGWVRTTDLARIDDDGFLFVLGRADQAIIRGGFKIIPDDVRAALERHPAVKGAVVVGRPDPRLGAVPVAAVELWPGGPRSGTPISTASAAAAPAGASAVDGAALAEFVRPYLAGYEVPVEIRVVDELPRTDSGKVDLQAAAALLDEPPERGEGGGA